MGRRFHEDTPRRINLSLPGSLLARVELHLLDPLTMRPVYGSVSALIAALLRDWVAQKSAVNPALTTHRTEEKPNG